MLEVLVTATAAAGVLALIKGRRGYDDQNALWNPKGDPSGDAHARSLSGLPGESLIDDDLPCPWCQAPTTEADDRCPNCQRKFGYS